MSPKQPAKGSFFKSIAKSFNAARGTNRVMEDCSNGSILTGRNHDNSYAPHPTPESDTHLAQLREANDKRRHQEVMALLNNTLNHRR